MHTTTFAHVTEVEDILGVVSVFIKLEEDAERSIFNP